MEQTLKSEKPVFLEITKEQSERIKIYKAFLAIMVVFIHAYPEKDGLLLSDMNYIDVIQYIISQIICRCAVPAYFFLSALFLYRKPFNYKTNLIRKLKTLGIPYLIMNTVWIVFFLVAKKLPFIGDLMTTPENNVWEWGVLDFFNAYLGFRSGSPILFPLWFIRDLLALNVLAIVVGKIVGKFPVASIVVALSAWLLIPKTGIFFLSITAIVFWVLGCAVCKKQINLLVFDKINGWVLVAVYVMFIVADILTSPYEIHLVIHNIGILVGMVFWYSCMTKFKKSKVKDLFLAISTYSFGVYIFHERTLTLLEKVSFKLLPSEGIFSLIQYFVNPIVIIVGCIVLCMLLKRFVPALYKLLTGSR